MTTAEDPRPRLTEDHIERIFGTVSPTRVIKFAMREFDLTYEAARVLLYEALDEGLVKLTPAWRIERAAAPDHQAEAPSEEPLASRIDDLHAEWQWAIGGETFGEYLVSRLPALAARPVVDDAAVERAADAIARARGYVQGACLEEHYRDARAALAALGGDL